LKEETLEGVFDLPTEPQKSQVIR